MPFKIWGTGDIVKDQETIPFSTTLSDYDNIESVTGADPNNHISIQRGERNLLENQEDLYNILEKLIESSDQKSGVFKDSLGSAFGFDQATDYVSLAMGGVPEVSKVDTSLGAVSWDNERLNFKFSSTTTNYYVWFNFCGFTRDPGTTAQEEISIFENTENGTALSLATSEYFLISSTTVNYYVWLKVTDGLFGDPAVGGRTGIAVNLLLADTDAIVATKIASTLNAYGGGLVFDATTGSNQIIIDYGNPPARCITVKNKVAGVCLGHYDVGSTLMNYIGASYIPGAAIQAGLSGKTGVEVPIADTTYTTDELATAIAAAIDLLIDVAATSALSIVTIVNLVFGNVTDISDGAGAFATSFGLSVDTQGTSVTKNYLRMPPGIAYYNGNMCAVAPQLAIAERQLIKAFNLENWDYAREDVQFSYNYTTDKYSGIIYKRNSSGVLITYTFNNGGPGYNTAVAMLHAIYTNPVFYTAFEAAITADFTKVILEPIVEVTAAGTKYFSIDSTGNFVWTNTGLLLWTIVFTGAPPVYSTKTDGRVYYQTFKDFNSNIYLNVPNTWTGYDTDVLEADKTHQFTPTYRGESPETTAFDQVVNKSSFITILRQHAALGAFGDTSANFGWVEGRIKGGIGTAGNLDPLGNIPDTDSYKNTFFMNKDLVVEWGTGLNDFTKVSNLAAAVLSFSAGFQVVANVADLVSPQVDGTVWFVKNENQFYRYGSVTGSWYPVSDPHKQFWGQVVTILAAPSQTVFNFTGLTWKTDGSNFCVYVDGIYKLLTNDYTITDRDTITFLVAMTGGEEVTVRIDEGGDQFYPDQAIYTVGTSESPYAGSTTIFPVTFQLVQTKVDVFVNGSLKRESEYKASGTITTGSLTQLIDSAGGFTSDNTGDWVIFKTATNPDVVYQIRKVTYVSATTLNLDSALPSTTTIADTYDIFDAFDYFVDEYGTSSGGPGTYDRVLFPSALTAGWPVVIKDRSSVIGTLSITNRGTSFPVSPIFGMQFYRTDLDAWYLYTIGSSSSYWQQIS
jgi:hypothetical protein